MKAKRAVRVARLARVPHTEVPRCGLCGSTEKLLTRTPCCDNLICDDEEDYVLFSFARNSCHRNHDRYTLCSFHYNEGHSGKWQNCNKCRKSFDTETYVYFGTNEYNFEKLENPPVYAPTHCVGCGTAISLSNDGYSINSDGYWCERCTNKRMRQIIASERLQPRSSRTGRKNKRA